MGTFELIGNLGHEQIVFCQEPSAGYRSIIAIHSTVLGPAVGGTRFWNYASEEAALVDAVRLSRGMTYKNAVAGLDMGGGKSVIIGNPRELDREKLFRAHGRFVERLGGRYLTAEDVGTSTSDMAIISQETGFVFGLAGAGGDPSPFTAHGVFRGIQAAAKYRWGSDDLAGRTVAIQGCGHVGYYLAKELHQAEAKLIVTDIDPQRVKAVVDEFGSAAVGAEDIYQTEADIFAPCALGGILNDQTIPLLKAAIVAGATNNQLLEERHGLALQDRGILYAPDYVVNAGGIISGSVDILNWSRERVVSAVHDIYDTMLSIFETARKENILPFEAADRMAERRVREASEKKKGKS